MCIYIKRSIYHILNEEGNLQTESLKSLGAIIDACDELVELIPKKLRISEHLFKQQEI